VADADIPKFFKMLSFKSIEEIDAILEADKERTKPMAQQLLAEELTAIVHGQSALDSVLRNIKALFDNNFDSLQEDDFVNLEKNGMVAVVPETLNVLDLMVATGLAKSKRQGREFIQSGAVQVNGNKLVVSEDDMNALEITDFKFGKFAVFQRGKREFRLIKKPA
jgi:tyrosyl-tRNA synthetase